MEYLNCLRIGECHNSKTQRKETCSTFSYPFEDLVFDALVGHGAYMQWPDEEQANCVHLSLICLYEKQNFPVLLSQVLSSLNECQHFQTARSFRYTDQSFSVGNGEKFDLCVGTSDQITPENICEIYEDSKSWVHDKATLLHGYSSLVQTFLDKTHRTCWYIWFLLLLQKCQKRLALLKALDFSWKDFWTEKKYLDITRQPKENVESCYTIRLGEQWCLFLMLTILAFEIQKIIVSVQNMLHGAV